MNLVDYLEKRGIPYRTRGEGVRKNNLVIKCPFCDDHDKHLNVSLLSGRGRCWRCSQAGSYYGLTAIIRALESCTPLQARTTVKSITFPKNIDYAGTQQPVIRTLPEGHDVLKGRFFLPDLPDLHKNYLLARGFDPWHIQAQYGILACYNTGDYRFRIIIPMKVNNQTVTFTTRDVTGKQEPKYKFLPDREALVPRNNVVYNIDTVDDKVCIVEGPTDVWRIGRGAVATLTTQFTLAQVLAIMKRGPKRIFTLYDNEEKAQHQAELLARYMTTLNRNSVEVICLQGVNDPGSLSESDARALRREIF